MSSVENTSTTPASGGNVSRFVGKYWKLLGYSLFIGIMSFISLGFATPWALSLYHKWTHANTDIDGDRLRFEGRGSGLYPQWAGFVVVFLVLLFAGGIIIGIGLSGFDHGLSRFGPQQAMTPVLASLLLFAAGLVMVFVGTGAVLVINRWFLKHTHIDGVASPQPGTFNATYGTLLKEGLIFGVLTGITFGLALPWTLGRLMRWWSSMATVEGRGFQYTAVGKRFFGRWILLWLGSAIIKSVQNDAYYVPEIISGLAGLGDLFFSTLMSLLVIRWVVSNLHWNTGEIASTPQSKADGQQ